MARRGLPETGGSVTSGGSSQGGALTFIKYLNCAIHVPDKPPASVRFKPAFEERYRLLLGDHYDEFKKISLAYIRRAIRANTLKIPAKDLVARLASRFDLKPVPWCPEGFWMSVKGQERFDIGNTLEHQLGYYYIQDPASMIPAIVLDPNPGELALDLCAAPGSKSTQMAAMMKNQGLLIANDLQGERLKALGINMQRCGVSCGLITHMTGHGFRKAGIAFDRVLVDAPCSGTGTIRRSYKVLQMWSPKLVARMARDQRALLESGWAALKPGGALVYSTCTLEPEENEGQVAAFLERHADATILPIYLTIKRSMPIIVWEGQEFLPAIRRCLRIYPQDNDSEGFFVAKLQKAESS